MAVFPPSTNAQYSGAAVSAWFLAFSGVMTITPGLVHYVLPDGGSGVIAHIDLTSRADTIIAIFAWYGAMQIPFGILVLIIALRYQTLTPLVLLLLVLMQGLSGFAAWFWKGSHGGHHPPEHYASVLFFGLGLIFFVLSVRPLPLRSSPGRACSPLS
jgi:hypothetical protein